MKPMLAKNARESHITYPIDAQPKLDGFRCIAQWKGGRVVLLSRRGRTLDVPHVISELESWLPPGVILDGELFCHDVSFQGVQRLACKDLRKQLALYVFDLIESGTWTERRARLERLAIHTLTHTCIVPTETIKNEAELWAYYEAQVQSGQEGVILREQARAYEQGHTSALLKLKAFDDAEFTVVGAVEGEGKHKGQAIFVCSAENGKPFRVVCRGSEQDRVAWYVNRASMVGRRLTVRHFGRTESGLPRSPVGVGFRCDADMPEAPIKGIQAIARAMQARGVSLRQWATSAEVNRQTLSRAIEDPGAVAFGTIKKIVKAAGFGIELV